MAARVFLRLPGVDVVWLAVRESRAQTAVIRCIDGARSAAGLGLRIELGVGVGGTLLQGGGKAGELWRGELNSAGARGVLELTRFGGRVTAFVQVLHV